MPKLIHLNGFTQCSICHHSKGQWKNPVDGSSAGYRDLKHWIGIAQTLERGCFDALFFADVHGTYDVYQNSRDAAVRHAVQFPGTDPTLLISALAQATQHLGFACTYSTTYFQPYITAKTFSTLDHLSNGRIAWNVVTSYLRDACENLGLGEMPPHDDRYDQADEYMEVVYKLWEHSWEEDAIVRDLENDIHTDPRKVHTIDHVGPNYQVPGPHMCEPSPQRTPVLFQAGQSPRGSDFAAKHAEAQFIIYPTVETCRAAVDAFRDKVRAAGRDPDHVKIFAGLSFVVADTDEAATQKMNQFRQYASPDGALALFSGWTGIDLSVYAPNQHIANVKSEAIQHAASYFTTVDPDRDWTVGEISEFLSVASILPKIIGGPETVADEIERWVDEAGIDGINVVPVTQPTGFTEFVDLVVPELQRRGRARTAYAGETLREHLFGQGQKRLLPDHVAHQTLPPWKRKSSTNKAAE